MKNKKNYKRLAIILGVVIFSIGLLALFISATNPNPLEDCLDFGLCAEGLNLKDDNGDPYIMTKEYCVSYNYTWIEETSVCNVRKRANR